MNKKEALEIICMIVDGINPYASIFNLEGIEDIPENNPSTIRALCIAIASLLNKRDRESLASCYRKRNFSELSKSVNGPLKEYFKKIDKKEIIEALIHSNYNDKIAAELLGITIFELDKKIKMFNLNPIIIANKFLIDGRKITLDQFLGKIKKEIVFEALNKTDFNFKSAARLLGIPLNDIKCQVKDISDLEITTNYLKRSQVDSLEVFIDEVEKQIIVMTFKIKNSNFRKTAFLLGITFTSLTDRIEKFKIEFADPKNLDGMLSSMPL
jgi:transcriptional regulator with PAS, ATPase and Fis domain